MTESFVPASPVESYKVMSYKVSQFKVHVTAIRSVLSRGHFLLSFSSEETRNQTRHEEMDISILYITIFYILLLALSRRNAFSLSLIKVVQLFFSAQVFNTSSLSSLPTPMHLSQLHFPWPLYWVRAVMSSQTLNIKQTWSLDLIFNHRSS